MTRLGRSRLASNVIAGIILFRQSSTAFDGSEHKARRQ